MKLLLPLLVVLAFPLASAQYASGGSATEGSALGGREALMRPVPDAAAMSTLFGSAATVQEQQAEEPGERKSVAKAALFSFLLPGMGELYTGNFGMGKYFTIAEGALWVGLFGVDRYAHWLQDDAYSFAAQHAGVRVAGKSEQFFIDIGNDSDIYAYNRRILQARSRYLVYDETPGSPYIWKWDSKQNLNSYADRRIASSDMFNNTRFIAAVIALNHLVSAVNAARLAISHNKNLGESEIIDVRARLLGTLSRPDGIMVSFTHTF